MKMELFKSLIDQATDIPLIDHITITGLGEPFLDKHLVERLQYVRKKMPGVLLDVYTNGGYLTEDNIKAVRDAGLSVLYVSLNAANARKRREVMKLHDFDKVREMCHKAIEMRGDMKIVVKAVMAKDLMEHDELEEFMREWGGSHDNGGHAFVHFEGNWAGAMYPVRTTPVTACVRALGEIMVLWDGRVSLCCFDGEGEVILGDLNKQTIKEVFNGPVATGIRQAHMEGRRSELKLCSTCTAI